MKRSGKTLSLQISVAVFAGCLLMVSACATNKSFAKDQIRFRARAAFNKNDAEHLKASASDDQKTYTDELWVQKPCPVDDAVKTDQGRRGCTIFEAVGTGTASKFERPVMAETRAEEDAVGQALKNCGVDVQSVFQDVLTECNQKTYNYISSYLFFWTDAIIDYKRVGAPKYEKLPDGGTKCTVMLRGKIGSKGVTDPGFEVKLNLKNRQLGLNQPVYYSDDRMRVSFWSTKDAYVNLIIVDEQKNASLIYPNWFEKECFVRGGDVFSYPDNDSELTDVLLKTYILDNKTETTEFMHIILTKHAPLFTTNDVEEYQNSGGDQLFIGDVSTVFKRLAKLERSNWTMVILPYEIRERKIGKGIRP